MLGGQLSILRTDAYQFLLLACATLAIFFLLYFTNYHDAGTFSGAFVPFKLMSWQEISSSLSSKFELLNESFNGYDLLYLSLLAGMSFFVGPDIFSRNLSAKNAKTAQRATFIAAFFLAFFAIIMTYIGMWVNETIESHTKTNLLIVLITDYLPLPIAIIFSIGLISALISSADTCLMSTAIILGNDILEKQNIKTTRLFIAMIGLFALFLALFKDNIIGLLLGAYSVYVPGVVLPLSVAIYFHKKRKLNHIWLFSGMFFGSFLGLCSSFVKVPNLALYGMAISGFCSFISLYINKIPYAQHTENKKTNFSLSHIYRKIELIRIS
jgi:SSS family solute:Na+ symporter